METGVQGLAFFLGSQPGTGQAVQGLWGTKMSLQNALFLLIPIDRFLKLAAQASLVYTCCRQL